jgi:hypothetical protein
MVQLLGIAINVVSRERAATTDNARLTVKVKSSDINSVALTVQNRD